MKQQEAVLRIKYEDLPKVITYRNQKGKIRKITIRKSDFIKIEHRGKIIYFNRKFYINLERIVRDVGCRVRDFLAVVAGAERVGKSFGLKQIGFVIDYLLWKNHNIDSPFTLDNIHFSAKDYMEARKQNNHLKNRIDSIDESKTDLDRKNRYDDVYKDFENYLAYCGSEYGFHLVCLPLWSDMGDYTILHRGTLIINFKAYRDEDGRVLKGIYDIYSIPYFDNVTIKKKTKADIKEIIAYTYKYKRFSPLPQNIKAMSGVCLDYEIMSEKLYDKKKDKKKDEFIHKLEEKKDNKALTKREKEIITNMPFHLMYEGNSSEYKVLDRLKKKLIN